MELIEWGRIMEKKKSVLAFDFGASSGRAMLGIFDGKKIELKEIHRFSNDPVMINGTLYWDVLRLFHEIKQGILKAKPEGFDSIGIDTWGVDFGLLDKKGNLLENPVNYRDERTKGMLELALSKINRERFYEITGNQFMEINTVFQLLSLKEKRPELLDRADCLLMMPDLFQYFLTGEKKTEYSIASTTQMMDVMSKKWSEEVLDTLGLPQNILTDIIPTGEVNGVLQQSISEELGVSQVPVIAVAGHDTQCAMVAVPATEEDFIFISCGTWSLFGTETPEPIQNEKSRKYDITNEGGYGGKISFLKNIIGLWLIQESRRQWIKDGTIDSSVGFGELEMLAVKEQPFRSFIDPDAPEFAAPGNIPERIREFCKKTGQPVPETIGQVVRCIDESLALKYRYTLHEISDCTGKEYNTIHLIGGGANSGLLCKLAADACNMRVMAGPTEATVLGNIAIQMIATGAMESIDEFREILKQSDLVKCYEPNGDAKWDEAFERFMSLL